jgi:hypothetical protein
METKKQAFFFDLGAWGAPCPLKKLRLEKGSAGVNTHAGSSLPSPPPFFLLFFFSSFLLFFFSRKQDLETHQRIAIAVNIIQIQSPPIAVGCIA